MCNKQLTLQCVSLLLGGGPWGLEAEGPTRTVGDVFESLCVMQFINGFQYLFHFFIRNSYYFILGIYQDTKADNLCTWIAQLFALIVRPKSCIN